MFDVVLGIAMIIAVIWWFGRYTSPSGSPPPESPPPRPTSGGPTPRVGPADRLPEATRGDDAFVDGLIVGAYWYGHWGRDAETGAGDPLPGLGDEGLGAEEDFEDDELGGGYEDPFGFDDDFDF